ncbi:NAD-P-binding protein [Trametes coccinea BRFM310]|uniref:NAD-P-binding protein n=1 Tax=Trametes coccinea (strain BRFM310) TaxID=1353009 RepID=A0A1Y2ICF0_TRAC3|nr:NAD-P-binding protein [Trametes coccinea BRFM310]
MSSQLPLVLVLGATGHTGESIVKGLLASGNFRVAALVRPASMNKPATNALRASGVEIRPGDVRDSVEDLNKAFAGVDILISAVSALVLEAQRDAFRAAKAAGVKRVVPCDFATPGEKGVRQLHDQKLAIRDFVKELGVPYTFIDVGWWMQLSLPLPERSVSPIKAQSHTIFGKGDNKVLMTDLDHIGTYVARIVADPRTLNHAVMVWEDERTQLEQHEIGERESGEGEALKAKRVYVSAEELQERIAAVRKDFEKDPSNFLAYMHLHSTEYMLSLHVLRENTLENAKRLGYLDARELYADVPKHTLEEFAKHFYSLPEPAPVYE